MTRFICLYILTLMIGLSTISIISQSIINLLVYSAYTENVVCGILVPLLFSYSLYWISPRPNTDDLAQIRVDLVSIWIDLLSIWKSLHLIGQNTTRRVKCRFECVETKTMAAIQPIE